MMMYIFKNSLKNIERNKGRNLLIGCVMLAIIATTVISLAINATTSAIIDDYTNRFGSEAFITPNINQIMNSGGTREEMTLTMDQYDAFAQSEHVISARFNFEKPGVSPYQIAIDEAALADFDLSITTRNADPTQLPTMRLVGTNDPEGLVDFANGSREITLGYMFEQAGEAIVSQEFAELNELSIGDTITFRSHSEAVDETVVLTVTGIYFDGTNEYMEGLLEMSGMSGMPGLNRRNEIITTHETLRQYPQFEPFLQGEASYFLRNPEYLEAFEADVRALGLSDYFMITTDEASFNAIVGPVEGLRSVVMTFMMVVLALGAIVLILLSSIAIRERKYEIGVLRAMGMKKGRVIRGFLYEMGMITLICLGLGLSIGTVAAGPIADTLLTEQIEASRTDENSSFDLRDATRGETQNVHVEPLDEIDVSLNAETILQISVIALAFALFASSVSMVSITRYEPIKILMERN